MTTEAIVLDVFHRGRPLAGRELERIRAALKDMGVQGIVLYAPYRRGESVPRLEGIEVWRAPRDRSPSGFWNLVAQTRGRSVEVGLCLGAPTALQRAFAFSAGLRTLKCLMTDGALVDSSMMSVHGARAAAKWGLVELPMALGLATGQQLVRIGGEALAVGVLARAFLQDPQGWAAAYREAAERSRRMDRFQTEKEDRVR